MSEAFTNGQKVTVEGHYNGILAITTVKMAGNRKLVLADDSEWIASGWRRWGRSNERFYSGPSVRAYKDSDEDKFEQQKLLLKIQHFSSWKSLPLAALRVIAAELKGATV